MSFATKTDLVGLAREGLELKANAQNASNTVLEIPGSDGSILDDIITGHVKNPTCDYAITSNVTLTNMKLGKVYNAPYALASIAVSTGAGSEPTFSATTQQIESGATQTICTYAVDAINLSPAHHASTFGSCTYTESASLVLNSSDFSASATIATATINNDPVASDATGGRLTVNLTFWSASETTAPAITIADGWHITSDWSCTGSDGQLYTWTVTLTKYLTASVANNQ